MWMKCFECETRIEGDNPDFVADRFVVHGKENHEWSYDEKAIRAYAVNFVEAAQRMTGGVNRLSEIGELEIYPVTAERIDDWLDFFDHDAFADNPGWASCYCIEPHIADSPDNPEHPWRENRAAMVERLRGGTSFGYLAYVDGKAAGWVNASTRDMYAHRQLSTIDGPESSGVIGVSCFVIAPPYRRHGIAAALLDRVIADAPSRGADWVEGYPRNETGESDGGHFRGPRKMYDDRGFEPVVVREQDTVMRRSVR